MTFDDFAANAAKTVFYRTDNNDANLLYAVASLAGETGEVCEVVKKTISTYDNKLTHDRYELVTKELGDVLWSVSTLLNELNLWYARSLPAGETVVVHSLGTIAKANNDKLADRAARGVLHGDGDNR